MFGAAVEWQAECSDLRRKDKERLERIRIWGDRKRSDWKIGGKKVRKSVTERRKVK